MSYDDRRDAVFRTNHLEDRAVELNLSSTLHYKFLEAFPHHAWSQYGILEFVNQRFRLVEPEQSIEDRRGQGKPLNALGSPFSLDTIAGNTPDFFRIGLEELFIEAPTESVDHPLLKGLFFWVRSPLPLQIAQQDSKAFFQSQIGNRVKQIQRVLIKTLPVVNAREPRDSSKIFSEHALPEPLN